MPKRRQKKLKVGDKKKLEVKISSALKNGAINRAPVNNTAEFDNEKVEKDKKLFMWVGVSCLMVIFFVAWIINLKYEFKASLNKSAGNGFNWSQTKIELDKAMKQVKQGLAEIKKIQASPSQSTGKPKLTAEQMNLLKGKLLNEVASSTASSTIKIKND